MKSTAPKPLVRYSRIYPAPIRWMARLALLTLVLQLSSLGHWSFGPYHPGLQSLEKHAAHCHGDTSACGGQPAFVGTYIERPLVVTMPATVLPLTTEWRGAPASVAPPVPDEPPRAA